MRDPQPNFPIATLCLLAVACFADDVSADVVSALPRETLATYMQLSIGDNTKLLAPAKAAFEGGNLVESRRLLKEAAAKSGIMPHPDVQLASWLMSAGKMGNAMQVLANVSLTESDRPDVRWVYAEIARNQGRLFDAWTHASLGEKGTPPERWTRAYQRHMLDLLKRTKAMVADRRGDWKTSEKLFKEMMSQGIRTFEVDGAVGRAAFFQDRPDEAFKYFQRASKSNEVDMIPELLMAALYEKKGEPEKAEEWFKKGDAAGADDAERIRIEYARWLIRRNRSEDARKVAMKPPPSDKNRGDFAYMVALCDRMEGEFAAAEKILSPLSQSRPKSFAISNQLALVLVESTDEGKRGRAMQIAESNVRNFPKSADAISTYAWVQHRLGNSAGANSNFNVLLQGGQATRDTAYYVAQVKYAIAQEEAADTLVEAAKSSEGEFFNEFRVDKKL